MMAMPIVRATLGTLKGTSSDQQELMTSTGILRMMTNENDNF